MAGELVKVEHRPGQALKLTRAEAEAYVLAHPGTRIVDAAPEPAPAPAAEAKAVQPAEVEDKAVRAPRTKRLPEAE